MTPTWSYIVAGALLTHATIALINQLKATAAVAGALAVLLIIDATGLPNLAHNLLGV